MEIPLLQTKFHIPPARPGLVSRTRLIGRLNTELVQNHGFARKLTLISAPTGFGKTTLVSEWVQAIGEASLPIAVAWLSLDARDNDSTMFFTYLTAALNQSERLGDTFGQGPLSMLHSPQPSPTETILTSLINEITAIPDMIFLILDDYHLIDAQPIHDAFTFLLEHLPPHMHIVIITRVDPPLPLARLRARGQFVELRATDLRFTTSEASDFLNQIMGLNLSEEEIVALETRTEGWVAGLQLAAISMQGKENITSLIESFTGSHRYVLDYLIEEVLNHQSDSIQSFLLQTSILNQFTGSLCDALTGQDNGQEILEMLDRANLFIVPLDEERQWYRYHHLFADLLHQRLHQSQPEQVPMLHLKASEWYEHQGYVDEAIVYALHAEAHRRAANLFNEHVDNFWQRGEHTKICRWLDALPVKWIKSNPKLCIYHAWYLFINGEQDTPESNLLACERALDTSTNNEVETGLPMRQELTDLERVKLRGRIAAIRTFMDSHRGHIPGILKHSQQALEFLPENDRVWRSIIALTLGDVYGFQGDMRAAYKARYEALQACKASGNTYYTMLASMKVAITLRAQGRLQHTIEMCQQQLQLADQYGHSQTPLHGLILAISGEVYAEFNDLDKALEQAKTGVNLIEQGVDPAFIGWGFMCLIRILFSSGDFAGIEEILRKVEIITQEARIPPWLTHHMATWQTRLWLSQNKINEASQWAADCGLDANEKLKSPSNVSFFLLYDYILLARILIAQGRFDDATDLLQQLLKAAEETGRTSQAIEILLLQALTYQAKMDLDQAFSTLINTLTLAEPEGFVRIFVDEGPPMARLLYKAFSRGITPDYVQHVLAAFPDAEPEKVDIPQMQSAEEALIEPLSERELEVLQLIAMGLTNREIATRLYLSLNTVKVHTRNIYGKLGVTNRTQASARARALGLVLST